MALLILSIIFTILAVLTSIFIMFANGMSDSPSTPFQGIGIILIAWLAAGLFWFLWLVN